MTCCSNSAKPGGGSGWRRSDVSSVADSRLGSSTGSEWGSAVGRAPSLSPDRDFIPVQQTGNLTSSSGRESAMPFDNPHHTPFGDAELLRDARSRVSNRNDWVQGRFQDGNRLCIVGALSLVCGSRSFNTPNRVERRLARVLVSQFPSKRSVRARFRVFPARQQLMWFNDDDRTSHADVMALFDRAIDRSTAQDFISL